MKPKLRRLLSVPLSITMLCCMIPTTAMTITAADEQLILVSDENPIVETYAQETVQGSAVLHCFDWSFDEIKANLPDIAAAGYTAIQTSPVQPPKDYDAAWLDAENQWWKLYQPLGFRIAGENESWLGTREELTELCTEAENYNIKVIVDVVANHLANDGSNVKTNRSSQIDAGLNVNEYFHSEAFASDNQSRYNCTRGHIGMPDLNTGHTEVQNYVLTFLKDCMDCGVDGFRFDAAKHIEVPNDPDNCKSDFWPVVINGIKAYAVENSYSEPFIYGEILGSAYTNSVSDYTDYIGLTDSVTGDHILDKTYWKAAKSMIETISKDEKGSNGKAGLAANQSVLWVESHDTYMGDSSNGYFYDQSSTYNHHNTSHVDDSDIIKAWAVVGSRADSTSLFFARPNDSMGAASTDDTWKSSVVTEINKFKNLFNGQKEKLAYSGNTVYNVRGSKGIVLSKLDGGGTVSFAVSGLRDGEYTDHITNSTFTVDGGTLTGTVDGSGVAVIYNDGDVEEPTITADTLYLVPNSDWKKDSARFAIYLFNESGNSWVSMTDNDGDGTYEAAVSSDKWTNVIFCRMNPAYTTNAWNNVWGQTDDLAPDSGMNCYTIQPGTWSGSSNPLKWSAGSWSTLTPACDHTYTVNWTWAADYSTATATLICSKCSDEKTVSATVSVDYVSNIRVHTATVTFGGAAYTDVKYEPMVVQNEPDGGVDYQIENAALLAELYNTIVENHPTERIDLSGRNLTEADGEKITQALQNCFPELFYVDTVSYLKYQNGSLAGIKPNYNTNETAETAAAKVAAFYEKAQWYLDQIDTSWDDFTKALVLHDLLVANNYYGDVNGTNTNYTFMVGGYGVCENYAEVYAFLLARLGIKSEIVEGTAGGAHEWVRICLDGQYYNVDVTWDDPIGNSRPNNCRHKFFLLSDSLIQSSAYDTNPHTGYSAYYAADDTRYDSQNVKNASKIVALNGILYTIYEKASNNYVLASYDPASDSFSDLYIIDESWMARQEGNTTYYYVGNFSGLTAYNGQLYFNGVHTINSYNPVTNQSDTIYTDNTVQFFDLTIAENGVLHGWTGTAPSSSLTDRVIPTQTYTVTWQNYNGEVLENDYDVPAGTMPSYDGVTPTQPNSATEMFTFTGWSPAVSAVTGDVTYTATFTKTTREYTITWKMDDGSTIDTATVAYGILPTHADAVKAADGTYTYTFTGWTPAVTAVTGEATYTAQFTATPIQAETMTLTAYNFIDWNTMYIYYWGRNDPPVWPGVQMTPVVVSDGLIYTATIPSNVTGVIFNNGDKTAMKQTVDITTGIADGAVWAVYNQTDANGNYTPKEVPTYYLVGTMNSWDTAGAPVFSPNKNDNHKEEYVLTTELTQGDRIKARDITSETGWFPYGEDPGITINRTGTYNIYLRPNRDGNADWNNYVLYAQAVTHTVTFDSNDGSAVESQTVYHNETATAPKTAPAKYGYDFMGWYNGDEAYEFDTPVTGDLTLTAHWREKQVSVTYTDINGINTVSFVGMVTGTYTLPSTPYLDGYDFGGWTVNSASYKNKDDAVAQISYLVKNGSPVAVKVVYNKQSATYKLIVANGTIKDTDGATESWYQASEQIYVVANDDSEGSIFSCWKASYGGNDEVVVGYERTYVFRMPTKGMTLTACYVSQAQDVADKCGTGYIETVKKLADNKMSFVSILSVPNGCQMLKAGIVVQKASELNGAELTTENAKATRFSDTSNNHYSLFKYTWTLTTSNTTTEWSVRPYLEYRDQNGVVQTVYGDTVTASLSSIS